MKILTKSNKKFKALFTRLAVLTLAIVSVTSLASTVIYAQANNPWNIQRNTTTNDLDFYLNSNGISGSSLQLKSNGSARVRSLYDLEDNTNTYLLDPSGNSRLKNVTIDSISLLSLSLYSKDALQGSDSWLRLNQSGQFTSGTHTPGLFAPMSLNVGGVNGWSNPGAGNATIAGNLTLYGYNGLNLAYAGYSTPNGTFRLTPNVHINTPTNYGVIVNWDNGSSGDASVGQFTVGNGYGSALFNVRRDGGTFVGAYLYGGNYLGYPGYLNVYGQVQALRFYDDQPQYYLDMNTQSEIHGMNANYYHTRPNDSWFPYPGNNWNYFRGYTYAFNYPWFDESNPAYYIDPAGRSYFRDLWALDCMMGTCPPNQVFRLTPNLHLNSGTGYALWVNYDNGAASPGAIELAVGNGVGGAVMYVTNQGNIYSGASGWIASDSRIKQNVEKITNPLDKIGKLDGVTFEYRKDIPKMTYPEGRAMGLIAQEVEKVLPEVVSTGPDGYKSVSYTQLIGLLIEGVKKLQEELGQIKQSLEEQKEINNRQANEIDSLRKELDLLKEEVRSIKETN
jgi:hypothetical protein